jgi:penicillin-binding protein 2
MYLQSPPPRREPEPDPNSLAIRAAALGVFAAILFGVLFFRLWALQVLRTDHFVAQAQQNDVRQISVPAPRGKILDSTGKVIMVTNSPGVVAQVNPSALNMPIDCTTLNLPGRRNKCNQLMAKAPAGDTPVCWVMPYQPRCKDLARLAKVLGLPAKRVWYTYEKLLHWPSGQVRWVANAGPPVVVGRAGFDQIAYVMERQKLFPGVQFERTYTRNYPPGAVAPNVLGQVGQISRAQLKDKNFHGLPNNAVVGYNGVEYAYDRFLRGTDGVLNQSFDAAGHAVGQPYLVTAPQAGQNLELTINSRLQKVAEQAIAHGIAVAHADGETAAKLGAIVAMDPHTGAILAMAQYPDYNPKVWVPPYKGQSWVANPKNPYQPLFDKSFQGQYPAGSTFKPFTAAAGWKAGIIGPGSTEDCSASFTRPGDTSHTVFNNWDPASVGMINLSTALEISCDTFFYRIGNEFYNRDPNGELFQSYLRQFGFGSAPPVDIPGASAGLVPDHLWREKTYSRQIDQIWDPGYDIDMAIGQGDLLVTPLQLATAYSALANGGILPTPHVAKELINPVSGAQRVLRFPAQRNLHLSPIFLSEVRQGLYEAAHSASGTSAPVVGSFLPAIGGKTGTADVCSVNCTSATDAPDAWYAAMAPYNDPKLVVVAFIENGGHGGTSAAPAALQVFQAYFHEKVGGGSSSYHDVSN